MANWNQENIDKCIEILQENVYVTDAIVEISEVLDEKITPGALRAAFSRFEKGPPSSYLGERLEPVRKVDNAEKDGPVLEWRIDIDNSCYHFYHPEEHFSLSFKEVETMCLMYCNVKSGGLNKTAQEVCHYLIREMDHHNLTPDMVEFVFNRIGFTKKMSPRAPHSRFQNMEQMAVRLNKIQDSLLKIDHKNDQLKLQQKMIKDLQDELSTVYSQAEFLDELKKEPVKLFNYSEVSNGEGVVDIIPITDFHIGKFFEPHSLTFLQNKYSKEVFMEQVGKICSIIKKGAQGRDVDMALVLNLGDTFEAILAQMRNAMFQGMDSWTTEAWSLAISSIVTILDTVLESYACPVKVIMIGGNHCRTTSGKDERTELFTAFQLTEHLKAWYRHEQRLTLETGSDINTILLPNGLGIIAQHGHIGPLKPLSNELAFVNFKDVHGHPQADRHLIISGHFHHTVFRSVRSDCHVCFMPAPFDADTYATDHLHKNAPAEYLIFRSDKKHLLIDGVYNLS